MAAPPDRGHDEDVDDRFGGGDRGGGDRGGGVVITDCAVLAAAGGVLASGRTTRRTGLFMVDGAFAWSANCLTAVAGRTKWFEVCLILPSR